MCAAKVPDKAWYISLKKCPQRLASLDDGVRETLSEIVLAEKRLSGKVHTTVGLASDIIIHRKRKGNIFFHCPNNFSAFCLLANLRFSFLPGKKAGPLYRIIITTQGASIDVIRVLTRNPIMDLCFYSS